MLPLRVPLPYKHTKQGATNIIIRSKILSVKYYDPMPACLSELPRMQIESSISRVMLFFNL